MACKKRGSSKTCKTKKASVKTTAAKKKTVTTKKNVSAKKVVDKKKTSAKKELAAPTDTSQILTIVKRFKKGVNVAVLKEKTGFEDKKIRNILYRASKQKKIKRISQGVYAVA